MKEVNTPGLELIGDDKVHGVEFLRIKTYSLMCKLNTELRFGVNL